MDFFFMIGRVCGLAMRKIIGIRYYMHVYTYIKLCLVKDTEVSYTYYGYYIIW